MCPELTDKALIAVGKYCSNLRSFNISSNKLVHQDFMLTLFFVRTHLSSYRLRMKEYWQYVKVASDCALLL